MAKILINFRLTEDESLKFGQLLFRIKSRPGKPPTKTDVVKALMGFDYYDLIADSDRESLSSSLKSIPEAKQAPAGARPGDKMRTRKANA